MLRVTLATSFLACALSAASDAAGAVLPLDARPEPAFVDMRMAVTVTPTGSTRWSEITVPAATPVMWLVPVRPGAAIDWAPRRWLDALDEATTPRVLPPGTTSSCASRSTPERVEPWTTPRSAQPGPALAVRSSADDARAYVAERGYRLSPALAGRISELYESGWNLVALEMEPSTSATSSSTLRVSDDGGAVLPLALSGASSTRVTVLAIGAGVASVPGARDIDRRELEWGPDGSNFVTWRRSLVEGARGETWLRESASHEALFDGTPADGGGAIPSVVAGYFREGPCTPSRAESVGSDAGIVGTSCAPGVAARVPGGPSCVPARGEVDPAALSCTTDVDLALALSGLAPASTVVTRLVGWIPARALGANIGLGFHPGAKLHPPVIHAATYESCPPPPSLTPPPPAPSSPRPPPSSSSGSGSGREDVYVTSSDGCGGGGAIVAGDSYYEEEPVTENDGAWLESCSGSSSSSGWDDSDSGDSCSTDDSSSSSSDSCSGGSSSGGSDDGWDTGDSDDGWDTEDGMGPQGKRLAPASKKARPRAMTTKKTKKSSPVSRYALLAAALLLPLRRRRRAAEDT